MGETPLGVAFPNDGGLLPKDRGVLFGMPNGLLGIGIRSCIPSQRRRCSVLVHKSKAC